MRFWQRWTNCTGARQTLEPEFTLGVQHSLARQKGQHPFKRGKFVFLLPVWRHLFSLCFSCGRPMRFLIALFLQQPPSTTSFPPQVPLPIACTHCCDLEPEGWNEFAKYLAAVHGDQAQALPLVHRVVWPLGREDAISWTQTQQLGIGWMAKRNSKQLNMLLC